MGSMHEKKKLFQDDLLSRALLFEAFHLWNKQLE